MNTTTSSADASSPVVTGSRSPASLVTMSADCSIHPFHYEFECSTSFASFQSWCLSNSHLPIYAVVLYLVLIYTGSLWMRNHPAYDLKRPLFAWNAALAIFSIMGSIRTWTELLHVLSTSGFHGSICHPASDNVTSLWRFAFVMSKYAELLDTFFIVARKKPLMFLHWYHHLTVLLFTWDTHVRDGSSSRYFVAINFLVHSVMYTYYAVMALGVKSVSSISIAITSMQIIQMAIGMFVLLRVSSLIGSGDNCSDSTFTVLTGLTMYASYFILFANFFIKRYVLTSHKKQENHQKKKKM